MTASSKRSILGIFAACLALFVAAGTPAQSQSTRWANSCLDQQVCELRSEILSNGIAAARVSVFKLRGQFILQYTIPLGVDLRQGIFVAVDEEPAIPTELLNCTPRGCTGALDLPPPLTQSMKAGSNLNILFTSPANQDSFAITFSLSGFTAGFNELVSN